MEKETKTIKNKNNDMKKETKPFKNDLTNYQIDSDWTPVKSHASNQEVAVLLNAMSKLQKGQSIFVPILKFKTHSISHIIKVNEINTFDFYLSVHVITSFEKGVKEVVGTRVFRKV